MSPDKADLQPSQAVVKSYCAWEGFFMGGRSKHSSLDKFGLHFVEESVRPIMPTHEGMEDFMPKVKYDRKRAIRLLEQIVEKVATSEEDRYQVAIDLFLVALDAQDTEYRVQAIINYLAKEFGVPAPKVADADPTKVNF